MNRLGLIGNPENRRIAQFSQAWQRLGHPEPLCLSYQELLADPAALDRFEVERLRIDSPGENDGVARALIALGGGPSDCRLEHGEIAYLREYHQGYCRLLERVERRGIACFNPPSQIAAMFDKWVCHQRFAARGLSRPDSRLAPPDYQGLLPDRSGRLFLKPLHGSSASGVCALRWTATRQELWAPLRIVDDRLINCLQVQKFTSPAEIQLILDRLLPQGMIAEQWIPKLALDEGVVDLRVLVIAGQARHRVVRQSRSPMTNLHLGNRRGSEGELRERIGEDRFESALRLAEEAAACFPGCLYAGVDILIDCGHRCLVGEINAFGDLLPGINDRAESAYTAIARASDVQSCLV